MYKKTNQTRKIFIFLVFFVLIFGLNFIGFQENIKNFFFSISWPVQRTFWQAGINVSDYFKGIFKINSIVKEIEYLEIKNIELIKENVSLKELEKENEFLRSSLSLGMEKDFQLILGQVISKDVFQDSLLINKGKNNDVLPGMPVITNQKVLVGRINEVYDNFSEIILITNSKSVFDAKIAQQEIYGMVKGKQGFKLDFELIPKDKEIFEKDIVITSARAGLYPTKLLVGKIKQVEKSDLEPFQKAQLLPFFDINQLDYLFIIKEF